MPKPLDARGDHEPPPILVRRECPEDVAAVQAVITDAFERPEEAELVAALRSAAIPIISLVAEHDGEVLGHILFSPAEVVNDDGSRTVAALAPMAVLPRHQRKGIGKALVNAGLEACKSDGYMAVIVLGHPEYYPKFGFEIAKPYGIRCPYDAPDEAFMAKELTPGALEDLAGVVRYHKAFDSV